MYHARTGTRVSRQAGGYVDISVVLEYTRVYGGAVCGGRVSRLSKPGFMAEGREGCVHSLAYTWEYAEVTAYQKLKSGYICNTCMLLYPCERSHWYLHRTNRLFSFSWVSQSLPIQPGFPYTSNQLFQELLLEICLNLFCLT